MGWHLPDSTRVQLGERDGAASRNPRPPPPGLSAARSPGPAYPPKACSFTSVMVLALCPSCFLAILAASGPRAASMSAGSTSSNQMSSLEGQREQAERWSAEALVQRGARLLPRIAKRALPLFCFVTRQALYPKLKNGR